MATQNIPSQTWTAGDHIYGPISVSAGQHDLSVQMAGVNDWQSGTPGRVILVNLQRSLDGGATWLDYASNAPDGQVSPNMGKAGALPTLIVAGSSPDSPAAQFRLIVNFSAPVQCGWTITFG
jgi:hypothetical protein